MQTAIAFTDSVEITTDPPKACLSLLRVGFGVLWKNDMWVMFNVGPRLRLCGRPELNSNQYRSPLRLGIIMRSLWLLALKSSVHPGLRFLGQLTWMFPWL